MKTYIYILQDPLTEEVRYVGKSNNPKRRYQSHLWDKPKVKYYSYYWIQSLLKKGLKPILTIIDETENNWQELEQYWIEQFICWGFRLTNITKGGEGSYGAGKWNNKQISSYDVEGNFIKTFISIKEASIYYSISPKQIRDVLKNRGKICHKLQFRYGNSKFSIGRPVLRKINHKGILRLSLENEIIDEFLSAKDAAEKLNLYHANIYQCLNNKRKTAYGYKWKYK